MIFGVLKYILRFIALLLLQLVVVNYLGIDGGLVNPFIYPLFILLLPVTLGWLPLMAVGLLTGVTMDAFMGTPGLHSSACILLAFVRPQILKLIAPREGYEFTVDPNINNFGFKWFIKYISICMLIHHFWLFNLEVFQFSNFGFTQIRVLSSTLLSCLLIIFLQYTSYQVKEKR
jgi:hypothetical protein